MWTVQYVICRFWIHCTLIYIRWLEDRFPYDLLTFPMDNNLTCKYSPFFCEAGLTHSGCLWSVQSMWHQVGFRTSFKLCCMIYLPGKSYIRVYVVKARSMLSLFPSHKTTRITNTCITMSQPKPLLNRQAKISHREGNQWKSGRLCL